MDRTVPAGAALLLDFIGQTEAPRGYGTIFGNNQDKLPQPLTSMTIGEVLAAQPGWTRSFKSSAAGRYQFMKATLEGLQAELGLSRSQKLDPDLQDRLGYHLLKRRGYAEYADGTIGRTEFARRMAQEWASFPVLAATKGGVKDGKGGFRTVQRGQSYYAGDGLNKALVKPETIEAVLDKVRIAAAIIPAPDVPPPPPPDRFIVLDPGPEQGLFSRLLAGLKSLFA